MSQQQTVSTYTARVAFAQKVHKQAEGPEDNQDAFEAEPNSSRFAVADGTTTSFFSAPWARLLVQHFCRDDQDLAQLRSPAQWESWLTPVRAQWQAEVGASLQRTRGASSMLLQNRYAEHQPAAATFVGLEFDYSAQRWRALVIGDSCLLHVREGRLLQSIPYTRAQEFSNITPAIASTPQSSPQIPQLYAGDFAPGDTFLLLTDAIARWAIAQHESGEAAWRVALQQLQRLRYWDDLRSFVDAQRTGGDLSNDDVTAVVLEMEAAAPSSPPISYFSLERPEVAPRPAVPASVNRVRSSPRAHTKQLLPQKQHRRVAGTIVLLALSLAVNAYLLIPWNRLDVASLKATLPAQSILYAAADGDKRIGRTTAEAQVLSPVISTSPERRSVQLSVWLSEPKGRRRAARKAGEAFTVQAGTRGYAERDVATSVVLLNWNTYRIIRSADDRHRFWYLVRVDAWAAKK